MQRAQIDQTYQTAWTIAKQLPPEQRAILARRLLDEKARPVTKNNQEARRSLKAVSPKIDVVLVALQQLSSVEQARMDELMLRNSDGDLSVRERTELSGLVERYEQMLLANSSALLRATQPQLFNSKGAIVSARAMARIKKETRPTK